MIDRQNLKAHEKFGFKFERNGAHTARTIMVDELETLLTYVNNENASRSDYLQAIEENNCLNKRSGKTRILTYRHLVDLYALDPSFILYRTLIYFWKRESTGLPLLALLCAFARDSVLRAATPFVLAFKPGEIIKREALEAFIDQLEPDRFSPATLKSVAQNINSSLTKSGHLYGKAVKTRVKATATPGTMAYALLLSYLCGARGRSLFSTDYVKLLECTFDQAIELTQDAARKGWLVFKHVGDVIEVVFPNLINEQEKEWLREQG